jgi:hypothetical protein
MRFLSASTLAIFGITSSCTCIITESLRAISIIWASIFGSAHEQSKAKNKAKDKRNRMM